MRMNKKKNIVPKLRFPEFMGRSWNATKLGKISSIVTEKAGENKYLLMSVTSGVGLIPQTEKFGREIAGDSYKNYIVIKKYDFAYNKSATKEFPEGYISMLEQYEIAAVPNSIFTCFRITDSESYPPFFDYLFHTNYHGHWLRKYIEVGARAHGSLSVDTKHMWSMPVALPRFKEQKKIADCLSSIDDLIDAENRKLKALQKYKKGLMQKLFPAEGENLPKWRFPEFQRCGGWEETSLGKVVKYENGKAHENYIEETGKYIVVNSKFISTDGEIKKYSNIANLIAEKGDILMVLSDVPNGRAIAKCYFVEVDNQYTVNQRICKLTPYNIDGLFLFYSINRNNYFLSFDDGLKQTNLKKNDVIACPVFKPKEIGEQQKIADCLSKIDSLIKVHSNKVGMLKTHKKGLIQRLFPSLEETDV